MLRSAVAKPDAAYFLAAEAVAAEKKALFTRKAPCIGTICTILKSFPDSGGKLESTGLYLIFCTNLISLILG